MNRWLDQIEDDIRGRELFRAGQSILVAVSGGLDSMVLLHMLHALAPKNGWRLSIGHFNHQLRGRQSDGDEQLVRETARRLKLPMSVGRDDVRKAAARAGLSIEMAARELRHAFLANNAAKRKAATIALAHHAGDQVELFFLRVLRGAGPQGLAGMKWLSPSPSNPAIQLARPLLGQSKGDLEAFARERSIAFSEDASNASLDIQRNRIRHELIPLLEQHYQPALTRTTLRLMELVGAEADFVTQEAERVPDRQTVFIRLPVAVQRRRLQLQLFKLNCPVDFELVEELRAFRPVSISPTQSLVADSGGELRFRKTERASFEHDSRVLELLDSGATSFGGLRIEWSIREEKGMEFDRQANREYFDADKVGSPIRLRYWQPGDRFQPIGRESSGKLQDLFTNLKVSQVERHKRVVAVSSGGGIFWVEGLRMSESFRLDKRTARRLNWEWHR